MLTSQEREWVTAGMAWVSLRRWLCGQAEGEAARAWFEEQMDLRFDAKHAARMIGPGMEALEEKMRRLVLVG